MNKQTVFWVLVCLLGVVLVACQDADGAPVATDEPSSEMVSAEAETPSADADRDDESVAESKSEANEPAPTLEPMPVPAKSIVICMGDEPNSLYPYGDVGLTATAVRHAIYEAPLTSLGYEYQPAALEKVPSLADGDAYFERVAISEGSKVQDAEGNIVRLLDGVEVIDADGNLVTFAGEPVEMEQLVVMFTFKPLVWSDGTAVSAEDSVFSYELAASPNTSEAKQGVVQTHSYTATGPLTVEWRGVAGLRDMQYKTRVWPPLPQHQLGDIGAAELLSAEAATRLPLSSGPFVVQSWQAGEMVLMANPHYYREGLPAIDMLTIRFGGVADWANSECDLVTHDAVLADVDVSDGDWVSAVVAGPVYEQISFGIRPIYEIDTVRPEWFDDARVRQALTMCTDRAGMATEFGGEGAELMNAYVPDSHPLMPDDLTIWPYDPEQANALLEEAGFRDYAGDGRRQDLKTGYPMTLTLGTSNESDLRLQIIDRFQENMQACGIPVETFSIPAGSWYAEGPQGPVFGRKFDLAEFAWLTRVEPNCGLFLSDNITGPVDIGLGGWNNINVTGYENAEYDALCRAAQTALPGGEDYAENQMAALRLFGEELPMIPLFTNVKTAVARPSLLNFAPDSLQPSELWNVADWDLAER